MSKSYDILLVEDDKSDAELLQKKLGRLDLQLRFRVINTKPQFIASLDSTLPDLIICNYHLPGFTGMEALKLLRKRHQDVPFILTSRYIDEEQAVEAMRKGASDYVRKDHLIRLGPAVKRELIKCQQLQKAEQQLTNVNTRYQSLIQSIDGIVWEMDINTSEYLYVSPQAERILGYPLSQWYGQNSFWRDHIHPEDRAKVIRFYENEPEADGNHVLEYRMITNQGDIVWLRDYVKILKEDEEPVSYRGLLIDITAQKKAEKQRDKAYQIADIGHWELDVMNNSLYWSPTIKKIHGVAESYQPELEEAFMFYKEGYHRKMIRQAVLEAIEQGTPYDLELQIVNKSGEERWIRTVGEAEYRDGECIRIYGSMQDINERKETELRLKSAANNIPGIILQYRLYPDGSDALMYVSEGSKRHWNISPEEAIEDIQLIWGRIHPEDIEGVKASILKSAETMSDWTDEWRSIQSDGSVQWHKGTGVPRELADGSIVWDSIILDITSQKKAEQAVRLSEQRFKSLVQEGSDLIAIIDLEGNYKYVTPTSERVLGIPAEQFIGNNAFEYIHEDDRERLQNLLGGLSERNLIRISPYRFLNGDGNWCWLETTITNMLDNPAVEGIVANSRDITEQIEREEKLRKSLERYDYVTKATEEIIYDWNISDDELFWDRSLEDTFGSGENLDEYAIDTIEDWAENVHPDEIAELEKDLWQALRDPSRSLWEAEYRFQKRDGSYATVFGRGFIIRDDDGKAIQMIGALQDITERKEYEEKLKQLSLVAAKTTDIISMTGVNDRITWVNHAFERLTGYSKEEAMGKNPGKLLQGPETNPETVHRIGQAVRERRSIREVILNYAKDGRKYWFDKLIDPLFDENGECTGFTAIGRDVTDKIKHQNRLKKSIERYEIVAKATSDTIWDLTLENDTIRYNKNIYAMFDYKKWQVDNVGDWWRNKIHPEDRPAVMSQLEKAIASGTDRFQIEYRFLAADGTYKYIYDRAFIVSDEQGKPVRIIGAMQDVTRQKEERKWLKLLESAIGTAKESIAIVEINLSDQFSRKILYVNDAFTEMTGYSREEVQGNNLHLLSGPKTSMKARKKLRRAIKQGIPAEAEFIHYKKNGEEFWAHMSIAPVKDSPGRFSHWIWVGHDVTSSRNKEKQLRESLKEKETLLLEIHHRVKNNLAVVSGMMQLQAFEEKSKKLRQKLNASVIRIKTMAIIHEILYQSRSFSHLDFSQNLKKLVSTIRETIQDGENISIAYDCESVQLNVNQAIPCSLIVNEVITNIFKHAFPDKKGGSVKVKLYEKDNKIMLNINDNGQGFSRDIKDGAHNTLGVHLIEVLSQQLNAAYDYKSPAGRGTHFMLQFKKNEVGGVGNAFL